MNTNFANSREEFYLDYFNMIRSALIGGAAENLDTFCRAMHMSRSEACRMLMWKEEDFKKIQSGEKELKASDFAAFCSMMDAYALQVNPEFLKSPVVTALFFKGLYDKPEYTEFIQRLDPDYFSLDGRCKLCHNGFADKYFRLFVLEQLAREFYLVSKGSAISSDLLQDKILNDELYVFSDSLLEIPSLCYFNKLIGESKKPLHILISQIGEIRQALLDEDEEKAKRAKWALDWMKEWMQQGLLKVFTGPEALWRDKLHTDNKNVLLFTRKQEFSDLCSSDEGEGSICKVERVIIDEDGKPEYVKDVKKEEEPKTPDMLPDAEDKKEEEGKEEGNALNTKPGNVHVLSAYDYINLP